MRLYIVKLICMLLNKKDLLSTTCHIDTHIYIYIHNTRIPLSSAAGTITNERGKNKLLKIILNTLFRCFVAETYKNRLFRLFSYAFVVMSDKQLITITLTAYAFFYSFFYMQVDHINEKHFCLPWICCVCFTSAFRFILSLCSASFWLCLNLTLIWRFMRSMLICESLLFWSDVTMWLHCSVLYQLDRHRCWCVAFREISYNNEINSNTLCESPDS